MMNNFPWFLRKISVKFARTCPFSLSYSFDKICYFNDKAISEINSCNFLCKRREDRFLDYYIKNNCGFSRKLEW